MKWKALVAAAALLPAAFADRLVLKNGEAFEGDFFGASSQEIRFVIKGKLVFFNAAEVARIEFAGGGDVIASEAARAPEVRCPPCPETCPEARAAKPEPEPEKPVVATVRRRAASEAAEEPEAAAKTAPGDAPAPAGQVVLPAGTVLTVNLLDVVDLKRDEPGSTYRGVLAAEVAAPGIERPALYALAETPAKAESSPTPP